MKPELAILDSEEVVEELCPGRSCPTCRSVSVRREAKRSGSALTSALWPCHNQQKLWMVDVSVAFSRSDCLWMDLWMWKAS